ncbi:hypothetical protein HDZ31DRAFT_65679 [Schizophyllum fasciatum]
MALDERDDIAAKAEVVFARADVTVMRADATSAEAEAATAKEEAVPEEEKAAAANIETEVASKATAAKNVATEAEASLHARHESTAAPSPNWLQKLAFDASSEQDAVAYIMLLDAEEELTRTVADGCELLMVAPGWLRIACVRPRKVAEAGEKETTRQLEEVERDAAEAARETIDALPEDHAGHNPDAWQQALFTAEQCGAPAQ